MDQTAPPANDHAARIARTIRHIDAKLHGDLSLDRIVLPAGRFLVVTCKGPFTRLPEAWAYTYGHALPEGAHAFREGMPFERYVSDSWDTKPEDRITAIWVPVA